MIINATGMNDETTLFTLMKHKINNTGWMMKWWWEEGWNERQTRILRECWTFLIYIFLHQQRKQCLEFALPKTERNLQIFGWCLQFKQSCPWATLSYYCLQNKAGKIKAMRQVVSRKMFQKSSALSTCFEMRRSPFANWIHYICRQKTTTSLWNLDRKGNWRRRKICDH